MSDRPDNTVEPRSPSAATDRSAARSSDVETGELLPIRDAASLLGFATSALRYYEARDLVVPARCDRGRRMYGLIELRRLALIKLFGDLGVRLDTAARILDTPKDSWRDSADEQIAALEVLIARARGARSFLMHARDCSHDHPGRDCGSLVGTLDHLVGGGTIDDLRRRWAPQERGAPSGELEITISAPDPDTAIATLTR